MSTSEPPDRIPAHRDSFHFLELLGEVGVIKVPIGTLGQRNDPVGKLRI